MANKIIQMHDANGNNLFPVCSESLIMPAFTTKGTLTESNLTISGGSITWARMHYAFTADRNIGMIGGVITMRGTGGSNVLTISTGLTVGTAPTSAVSIYGPFSSHAAVATADTIGRIQITTGKALNFMLAASTNNTTFWMTPTILRFSDFY